MLLCEPNVSEGRDEERIAGFAGAVRAVPSVDLIHCSADPDHHRLVLAYAGPPQAVLAATRGLATQVFEALDLGSHRGEHPRVGALDVVPFIPARGTSWDDAIAVCRSFGRWVGGRGIPVLYYEGAASTPARRGLPGLRRGEYEGLAEKLRDPAWAPDEGPPTPHPTAGAVIAGVRGPLVRFNVNLESDDPAVARRIARKVRESSGGLPHVRALGIELARRGMVQVSMNLIRHRVTSIADAHAAVAEEAAREGVRVAGAELIGPVPRSALEGIALAPLNVRMSVEQIIDLEEVPEPPPAAASGTTVAAAPEPGASAESREATEPEEAT